MEVDPDDGDTRVELTQGMEWLKPNDPEQLRWAATYLAARGLLEKHEHPDNRPFGQQLTHEDLVRIGRRFQGKRALIKDMKAAWRQKQYRESENGRRTCSFTLETTTKTKLKELAGDGSESAILESLKAYKVKLRKEQKPGKAKQTLQMDRPQTLEEIRALMTEDTSRPDDSGVTSQTLPEASMNAPRPLERPPLVADTADSPKTAEPPPEPAAVQANETSLNQGGANCALPDSLHDSQVPAATADEDRPEQTVFEISSPKPNDAPLLLKATPHSPR
ncbi:hypothetical protein DY989_01800 [Pseudomonas aeruginosa]|uniref:hypothetical protein n=1 Tax=Pseudomonas aeruginosa TaxID=287 RepID=UPI000F81ABC9|nr:hypothetical protein [Pseudomonas aeruginosa]RTV67157.1 hypothetical protein DY989_01800 [Pseudomonas aeruginosa]